MAARRLLGLLLLATLCAATVQPFSHDLFELYPINEGMIAVFGGGVRLGALVDINDATHIFTEGELLAPDTAAPWSMSKMGSNRVVGDALGTKQAEITEDITFLQKLWGAHAIFHLKDAAGSEIATVEKETQGDRTILHFKRGKQVLANLVIEGQVRRIAQRVIHLECPSILNFLLTPCRVLITAYRPVRSSQF